MNIILATAIAVGISGAIALPTLANEDRTGLPFASKGEAHLLTQTETESAPTTAPDFTEEELILEDPPPAEEAPTVEFFLRMSTEIFRYGDDNVELQLPMRYRPSGRVNLEVSPFLRYQPEDDTHNLDYGVRAAVEYRL